MMAFPFLLGFARLESLVTSNAHGGTVFYMLLQVDFASMELGFPFHNNCPHLK